MKWQECWCWPLIQSCQLDCNVWGKSHHTHLNVFCEIMLQMLTMQSEQLQFDSRCYSKDWKFKRVILLNASPSVMKVRFQSAWEHCAYKTRLKQLVFKPEQFVRNYIFVINNFLPNVAYKIIKYIHEYKVYVCDNIGKITNEFLNK